MAKRKPIVGLCGGIGSGKSTVAAEFAAQGCVVIDSDRLNHEVLERPEVARTLVEWWGAEVLSPDGKPSRSRIAAIIFADAAEKARLERLTHPLIADARAAMIRASDLDLAVKAIILDSPLLFESNLDRSCDRIVFVEASETRRLARLRVDRQWGARELHQREQWQLPIDEKRKRSDFVISNEGSIQALRDQVSEILDNVLA